MSSHNNRFRRLAAGIGAFTLTLVGVAGVGTAAYAAGFVPPTETTGTLTLHKHVAGDGETEGSLGAPLSGVVFSSQEVGILVDSVCKPLDLTTPAGWNSANTVIDYFEAPATAGQLPIGYCKIGTASTFTATDANGETTKTLNRGLYLITETSPGSNLISTPAAPFLVTIPMPVTTTTDGVTTNSWDYSVDAYPKNVLTTVTPTKTVGTSNVKAEVVPGALVPWTITVPVPVAAFPYTTIEISDVPSAGHTFEEFTGISVNDVDLENVEDGTQYYSTSGSTVTLLPAGLAAVNAIVTGTDATTANIVVTLTTKINTGIKPGTYTNQANVNLNGTTTPTTVPKSYWGKLSVLKHATGDTTEVLGGAEFSVYEKGIAETCVAAVAAGSPVATGTTDATTGLFETVLWIANAQSDDATLKSKIYCLVETAAPQGYLLDSTPREITLSTANDSFTTSYQFPNTQPEGPDLPLTGAQGTLAMTLGGLLLVGVGGGALVVSRRRTSKS